MESADFWTNVGLILGGILLASVTYFKSKSGGSKVDAATATMGLFADRETLRNVDKNVERIADALESLADKKQDHMSETIDKILKTMEMAEARKPPRRPP